LRFCAVKIFGMVLTPEFPATCMIHSARLMLN
jgi:hypothetical protein